MSKIIKKIAKVLSYTLLLAFLLPVIVWILLQIPAVQDFGVSKATRFVADELGIQLRYTGVRITNFNRIRFTDLYISDTESDTLIYAEKLVAVTPVVFSMLVEDDPSKPKLKRLILDHATLKLRKDSQGDMNLKFLIDFIKTNQDSTKVKKPFHIRTIQITNSVFVLQTDTATFNRKGINFSDLRLTDFNVKTKDLTFFADTVAMDIKDLNFEDASGFHLEKLVSHMELCNSYMHFSALTISTPFSIIEAPRLHMDFAEFASFKPDQLFEQVNFDIKFENTALNTITLGYFSEFFWDNDQNLMLTGEFYGPLSNLKSRYFTFNWGNSSLISGEFDINGLPDIQQTFLIFDLRELVTNTRDIEGLNLPGNRKIVLPQNLSRLQSFRYRGNFTGFFNDFVANGRLNTDLGALSTDLMFSPDSLNRIRFSGRVRTDHFEIGKLFAEDAMLGDMAIDAGIKGILSEDGPVVAGIQGDLNRFTYRGYGYRNLQVDGEISNRRFSGTLSVNDPNLNMEFNGLIDLAAQPRQYDFTANVIDANLTELNISDADPNYHASFLIKAKAEGNDLDELNGQIQLLNSLFTKTNKQIQVYGLELDLINTSEENRILLRSDIMDADVAGKYRLSTLGDQLIHYLERFVPNIVSMKDYDPENLAEQTEVEFSATFKRTTPFFEFFFPDYLISEKSRATGIFITDDDGLLKLDLFAPEVKMLRNQWRGFMLNVWTADSVMFASAGSQVFNFNERIDLENFTVETETHLNEMLFTTRWLNWDSALYKGALGGTARFAGRSPRLAMQVDLDSSSVTINDSVWHMKPAFLSIDSSGIKIEQLELRHDEQLMYANGKLSDTPGDSLDFAFTNFDLAHLNFFTRKKDFEFRGTLNGQSKLTGLKENPLFFSSLDITDLYINGEEFGNCAIYSIWNNRKQSLSINAEAQRGELTMLEFSGDYYPSRNGKMDFQIKMDKLKLNVFNPFLTGVFSDMRGLASGDLLLTGFRGKPSLSGSLKLQRNAFTVDYLKTRYNFTTEVEVVNNNFIFNNVEIFDPEGNKAIVNGMIHTEYLKDITLSLAINTRELLCMNTREYDNSSFYGTAYATGDIRIKGPPSNLTFKIDATTDKNTRFFIPLSEEGEVSEFGYINFIRSDTTSKPTETTDQEEYKVDMSGIQMDFNLRVTPEAEVQIIFDSRMGDIIKAEGEGEMQMSINTLGSFELIGEYVISQGEYLFTMQDVINKRLKIEEGSNLRWTGDPLNAQVDITAVYRTRASLSDLYGDAETAESQGKVTVDCAITLRDELMSPNITYDIRLPYAEEDTRARVESKIGSEEELTKQFLSLMVLNRFLPNRQDLPGGNIAGVNASELLSNQLSNWLSQISNDVDVGVNYRPGTGGTKDDNEVEVALSTQLLNDRLTINGSVGTNAQAQNSSSYMGDIDIDYKLTRNGKWRARTFFRTNDDQITTSSKYTTGVGMFYMEEFNNLGDLFGKNREEKDSGEATRKEDEE